MHYKPLSPPLSQRLQITEFDCFLVRLRYITSFHRSDFCGALQSCTWPSTRSPISHSTLLQLNAKKWMEIWFSLIRLLTNGKYADSSNLIYKHNGEITAYKWNLFSLAVTLHLLSRYRFQQYRCQASPKCVLASNRRQKIYSSVKCINSPANSLTPGVQTVNLMLQTLFLNDVICLIGLRGEACALVQEAAARVLCGGLCMLSTQDLVW